MPQCFIKSFRGGGGGGGGVLSDVIPVSAVLWCIGIGIFNLQFFAKLNKPKFKLNSNGTKVSYFFIFCVLIVLIICSDIELYGVMA